MQPNISSNVPDFYIQLCGFGFEHPGFEFGFDWFCFGLDVRGLLPEISAKGGQEGYAGLQVAR